MKKLATILMLVAVLFVGGATIDAKTTKKKAKARTTQTSSDGMWNGDIPTGKNLCTEDWSNWSGHGYYKKGYKKWTVAEEPGVKKDGVCSITPWREGVWGGLNVTVYDTNKLNWLYNDLLKANSKYKTYSGITKNGNCIKLEW